MWRYLGQRPPGRKVNGAVKARRASRRRAGAVVAAAVLSAGMLAGGSAVVTPGTADAAVPTPCGSAVPAGSNCTMTGTLTITPGTLSLTSPTSLTWAATLSGTDQSKVDTILADQQYTVDDATGSGGGWSVTTSATTFTNASHKLPDTGTFVTNGSGSTGLISDVAAPTATCALGTTCTLPNDSTTYPVAITTAATAPTASTIYHATASSGVGQIVIGGSTSVNPVGWWVNVPASAFAGAYTSTVTMAVIAGP